MAEGDKKTLSEHNFIKDSENAIRDLCRSIKSDRTIGAMSPHANDSSHTNDSSSLSDTLPGHAAISIVEAYCRTLPADEFISLEPEFLLKSLDNMGYMATCYFPPVSELPSVQGSIQRSTYT